MLERDIVAGAIGQLLFVVFGIARLWMPTVAFPFSVFVMVGMAVYSPLLGGSLLLLVTTRRISHEYRYNPVGSFGAVTAVFAALIGIGSFAIAPSGISYHWGTTYTYWNENLFYLNQFGLLLFFIEDFFLGVAMGLIFAFYVIYREWHSPSFLWVATALVYGFGAVFALGLLAVEITYYSLIPAGIMGTICLLVSRPATHKWE